MRKEYSDKEAVCRPWNAWGGLLPPTLRLSATARATNARERTPRTPRHARTSTKAGTQLREQVREHTSRRASTVLVRVNRCSGTLYSTPLRGQSRSWCGCAVCLTMLVGACVTRWPARAWRVCGGRGCSPPPPSPAVRLQSAASLPFPFLHPPPL